MSFITLELLFWFGLSAELGCMTYTQVPKS